MGKTKFAFRDLIGTCNASKQLRELIMLMDIFHITTIDEAKEKLAKIECDIKELEKASFYANKKEKEGDSCGTSISFVPQSE